MPWFAESIIVAQLPKMKYNDVYTYLPLKLPKN